MRRSSWLKIIVATAVAGVLCAAAGELHRSAEKLAEFRRALAHYKSEAEEAAIYCASSNFNLPSNKVPEYPEIRDFDYDRIITLHSEADVLARRVALRRLLFGEYGPSYRITEKSRVAADDHWLAHGAEGNVAAVFENVTSYRFRVNMVHGLQSSILHHVPGKRDARKSVVIYHKGHGSDYSSRFKPIGALLAAGHEVFEIGMPLVKENKVRGFVFESPRYGPVAIRHHDDFWFMDIQDGSPLRFFVEPVLAVVDRIAERRSASPIVMVGLSGGGWTTILAAAIEPRISRSIAIAGNWPEFLLTSRMRTGGDYEQVNPELYRIASRLELYILAGVGTGRRHTQIFNENDTCCFAGAAAEGYERVVQGRLARLGSGQFDVEIDKHAQGHVVGDAALQTILSNMH